LVIYFNKDLGTIAKIELIFLVQRHSEFSANFTEPTI